MNWIKLLSYAPELIRLVEEISKNHGGSKPAVKKEIRDRADEIRAAREKVDAAIAKKYPRNIRTG